MTYLLKLTTNSSLVFGLLATILLGIHARDVAAAATTTTQEDPNYNDDNMELDCAMRRLFFEIAVSRVPWRLDMKDVHHSLELESRCNESYSYAARHLQHQSKKTTSSSSPGAVSQFFVCPKEGKDLNSGNETHPFATVERALEATRALARQDSAKSILLSPGIHFLSQTLVLTPKDSHLTIQSSSDERAWLSGGVLIPSSSTEWKPTKGNPNIYRADLSSSSNPIPESITGLFTVSPHKRMTLARFPNANVEEWNAPNRYVPSQQVDEWMFPPFGDLPTLDYWNLSDPTNPTGHVKNDSTMPDYNTYGVGRGGACATVWGDQPSYWCSNVSAGGWAFVDRAAALAGRMNIPIGMVLSDDNSGSSTYSNGAHDDIFQRAKLWKNPRGAIVHAAHSQGWAWHMFNISNKNMDQETNKVTLNFDKGGWQGGRNWQCTDGKGHLTDCNGDDKKLHGGDWYVEGVLEELDEPGEFFYDTAKKQLYFYPPNSTHHCVRTQANTTTRYTNQQRRLQQRRKLKQRCIPDLTATNLQTLIKMQGTMENPVQNVRLLNIGFRDASKTYMEQWSSPSGGDWSLHRGGAVHLDGVLDVTIADSAFRRLDGDAIMLSGYAKHTQIARNDFSWIGNGAIATWGDTDGYDATQPTQPRQSVIQQNVMSNLGLYQKQSSAWGQNKACQNIIRDNVMFDLPRAAINFNDGLGGGNLVNGNVIFNSCRESGDHGPINSWDRMPFLTNTSGLGPSFTPMPTHTSQNIILANYGAAEGFDNDDGSSFYHTHENVFYVADGFKMDFGGHDSVFRNNLVYGHDRKHCFGTGSFVKGHADVFANNTCLVIDSSKSPENTVGTLYQCSTDGMNPTNNRYFTNTGNASWRCMPNSEPLTLQEMQQKGFEIGSSVGVIPSVETIISWARSLLGP